MFLQAIARAAGPAAQAFRLVERGVVTLHVSRATRRETRAVLAYPALRERNPWLTDDAVDGFLTRVVYRSIYHRSVARRVHFSRDRADEPYLDLAVAAEADYLVSRDNDLLSLATDHTAVGTDFRRRCPGVRIVDPAAFVREMEGASSSRRLATVARSSGPG